MDRGKQGLKRSTLTDAAGIPLHRVSAGAHHHDTPLLAPTMGGGRTLGARPAGATLHLDRGDDGAPTRALLAKLGLAGAIAHRGVPSRPQSRSAAAGWSSARRLG